MLLMMTVTAGVGTIYTVVGGMLSVLVTDFLQFIVMSVGLIAVTILILTKIGWEQLVGNGGEALQGPAGSIRFSTPGRDGNSSPLTRFWRGGHRTDVANHDLASAGGQGRQDRAADLHPHQLLFCLPLPHSGHLGHCRAGRVLRPRGHAADGIHSRANHALCHADVSEPVRAGGADGPAAGGHAGGRYVEHLLYMLTWGSVIYNDILAPFRKTTGRKSAGCCGIE